MNNLKLPASSSHERERRDQSKGLHFREVLSLNGEILVAHEHEDPPRLAQQPVRPEQLSEHLLCHLALEGVAMKVVLRGRWVASLRPLVTGEGEALRLEQGLDCRHPDFADQRKRLLEAMACGQHRRVLLRCGDQVLACLEPLPPERIAASSAKPLERGGRQQGVFPGEGPLARPPGEERGGGRAPGAFAADAPSPVIAARVEAHMGLVRALAWRTCCRVGEQMMDRSEFESAGNEALVRSALRYDSEQATASFATYAHYRIRGAMLDALRQRTPGLRKRDRDRRRRRGGVKALTVKVPDRDEYGEECLLAEQPDEEKRLIAEQTRQHLWNLVKQLQAQDQDLICALYVEERSMTEIAERIGVSTATISRRHAKVLRRLRARLASQELRSADLAPDFRP